MKIMEYEDEYNPFNKFKLLVWANYWEQFEKGVVPPPIAVSVDPINICGHRCVWCNAEYVLKRSQAMLSKKFLSNLSKFLSKWGVKSVCVGGGGEPLLNPYTGNFIVDVVKRGVEVGVVTNGVNIDKFLPELSCARWIGVSVDAGTEQTHSKLHRPPAAGFKKIISNIRKLVKNNRDNGNFEVSYKFLMHPANIHELYTAALLARDLGVNRFHARPVGEAWFDLKKRKIFSGKDIKTIKRQAHKIFKLHSEDFKVYMIVSRNYTDALEIKHQFSKCCAVFMTCVFRPDGSVGLCCDRRGDAALELCRLRSPRDILKYWGSRRHKSIAENIRLKDCPRCTYSSHNEIYENVVKKDSMFLNFI